MTLSWPAATLKSCLMEQPRILLSRKPWSPVWFQEWTTVSECQSMKPAVSQSARPTKTQSCNSLVCPKLRPNGAWFWRHLKRWCWRSSQNKLSTSWIEITSKSLRIETLCARFYLRRWTACNQISWLNTTKCWTVCLSRCTSRTLQVVFWGSNGLTQSGAFLTLQNGVSSSKAPTSRSSVIKCWTSPITASEFSDKTQSWASPPTTPLLRLINTL